MQDQPDLSHKASFQHWSSEKLRFSDTDMLGHVNNVAFAALIESGRVGFTHSGVIRNMPKDLLVVMRRIELDYRAEMHWPATVEVGSRLLKLGRTSFNIGNGVFVGERCAATSVTVMVVIGRTSRKPEPIPPVVREGMSAYLDCLFGNSTPVAV